jgi:hypothetical protein
MATIKTKNGKVLLKNGKPSCECCGSVNIGYTICIDNSNQVLDNSWRVELNGNFIANYDGNAFFNQCFNIPVSYLNLQQGGSNTLTFTLTACQNDDFWEFYILNLQQNEVYRSFYSGPECGSGVELGFTFSETFKLPQNE